MVLNRTIILLSLLTFFSIHSSYAQTTNTSSTRGSEDIPTQQEWANALIQALGRAGPRFSQMIISLSKYCGTEENFNTGLAGNCDDLYFEALNNRGRDIMQVLRQLRPREVIQSSRTSAQIMNAQQANISSRLIQLRAQTPHVANNSKDSNWTNALSNLSYLATKSSESNYDNLVSPWGFFINGKITDGSYEYEDARMADSSREGYDFDTQGITAGVDYRFNNKLVAGLAIGYANFDSTIDNGASMSNTAYTYSAYGSFNINDNWYVDFKASYGRPDFTQARNINFTLGGNSPDFQVTGKTSGTEKSYVLASGYQFNINSWSFTPSLTYEFNKTQVDQYKEQGNDSWNVGFSEQNYKTNRLTFGIMTSKEISLNNGILIPSFGYEYINENQNKSVVLMRVSGMPSGEFFESPVNFNDDSYSKASLGLTFVARNGKQAYLQYTHVFSWEGFSIDSLNLGARFEF